MTPVATAELRPLLKWAGGKRWQLPVLRRLWAGHERRRLVEPFCGGLGVAMGLRPEQALLNDVNPHLVNFYRWVRRGLTADVPMANDRALFDQHRRRFNALLQEGASGSREAALLFYYLNRTGYNGLCRFNRRGAFNVPFGRYARIQYRHDFSAYRDLFTRWTFSAVDVSEVGYRPEDFVYADPPYDVRFTQYARGGFAWADQQRTAELLARHPGPVVLVNQATPRVEALYRECGYVLEYLNGPRRINCTGDRTPAREILATRNL
jgi:DNA adenine methylase